MTPLTRSSTRGRSLLLTRGFVASSRCLPTGTAFTFRRSLSQAFSLSSFTPSSLSFPLFSTMVRSPSSFIIHHSSFIIHHSSFIIHHSSFIIHHSSLFSSRFDLIRNDTSTVSWAFRTILSLATLDTLQISTRTSILVCGVGLNVFFFVMAALELFRSLLLLLLLQSLLLLLLLH